ncbi:cupin domain-containing protein [Cryobacterium sp. PAMC25264]|uniref:cupin domain-containing protein n=1 Tax=Cryobacterium sp. PAMC25264 TaxID=2861288 RepID=UPI001C627F01|nr:cupin domain-containing protein [Cryobacterium sp. PAMC25264]QYF72267.1 cupin domain-containing protein [Cryobacterium sp. PAMC25264]
MTTNPSDTRLATRRTASGEFIERLVRPVLAVELGLEPHPEGGWYRRTWTSPVPVTLTDTDGSERTRPAATLIHFLLPAGEFSAWHRVASSEIWIWNGQGTVELELGGDGDEPESEETAILGGRLLRDERSQVIIPADVWQRTVPSEEDALVSCLVSPGFDFADFSME